MLELQVDNPTAGSLVLLFLTLSWANAGYNSQLPRILVKLADLYLGFVALMVVPVSFSSKRCLRSAPQR